MNYLKSSFLLSLFIVFTSSLFGQALKGTISDKSNNSPLKSATIYVNGTNIGTITDSEGNFSITPKSYPCTIVISCIGYKTGSIEFATYTAPPIKHSLEKVVFNIKEVQVNADNKREDNLLVFRREFLGEDKWGKNAVITNEDAISFKLRYKNYKIKSSDKRLMNLFKSNPEQLVYSKDSSEVSYKSWESLHATSTEPLIVHLPLLGYEVHIDLEIFTYGKVNWQLHCSSMAYNFFKEIPFKSKKDSIKITQNRMDAYYNSSQHFLHSLCQHKMAANGYKIVEKKFNLDNLESSLVDVNLEEHLVFDNDLAYIVGCKDKMYHILYYYDSKGKPKDYTIKRSNRVLQSQIFFAHDSCLVKLNGTQAYPNITFTPTMALKKYGALLPDDFQP